jgi:endonuclease/exonuclease/phosphatase (EEP) superfamily protein YafD
VAVAGAALVPHTLPVEAVAAFVAIASRRKVCARVCLVGLLLAIGVLANRFPLSPRHSPTEPDLTLATANVYFLNRDVDAAVKAVTASDADVVLLQEVNPDFAKVLSEEASAAGYRWRVLRPTYGVTGMAVLSRYRITGYRLLSLGGQPLMRVDISLAGTSVHFYNIHLEAPVTTTGVALWRDQLHSLRQIVGKGDHGPTIAAGDFNATIDERPFRSLLDGGRHDAAIGNSSPWLATWPANRSPFPPILQLDHFILPSTISTLAVKTAYCPGSDHRMLLAALILAPTV